MAVEVEGTSQVEEFLGILRRRAWWIAIPTLVLGALGIAVGVIVPKKFVVTSRVLVRDVQFLVQQSTAGAVSRMEGSIAPHVIGSGERVKQVLSSSGWSDYFQKTSEEQNEYRADLMDNLHIELYAVQNSAGAQIVRTRFSHTSPERAYFFLNEIVNSWKSEVQDNFELSERKRLETLKATEDDLENELARVSRELGTKRRANKIRPDVVASSREQSTLLASSEFGELDRVKEAIETDTEALKDLESRIARWQRQWELAPPHIERTSAAEAAGGVAAEIAKLEAERQNLVLEIAKQGWTAQSTSYKKAQRDIEAIGDKLEELRGVGSGRGPTVEVEEEINPERVALSRQIAEALADVEVLNERLARNTLRRDGLQEVTQQLYREHEAIGLLQAEFDKLSQNLEDVSSDARLQESQVAMIESDAGTFFEDLETPRLPSRPTTPNPYIIAALFWLGGLALGLGLSVLIELSRSTFRSARDLSRVMVVPVLGTVNEIVTRRQRSRHTLVNVALASATLAIVGVVGYVTWAWVYDRDALSAPVREAIDGLREPFL